MDVTVAICTWNRAGLLDRTLASLAGLVVPRNVTWRVIVANNNSTDATESVLRRHADRLPLRSVLVPNQGKSHALNAIVRELTGDLVLWTDDDILFHPRWLAAYADAAEHWPDASFFGGPIQPRFLTTEPAWLRPAWSVVCGVYGERELGPEPFAFNARVTPFGANMACRVAPQREFPYDPKLGRIGESMVGGEETTVVRQMLAAGHHGYWIPQARVEHLITPDAVELDHLRRTYFCQPAARIPRGWKAWNWKPLRLLRGAWYAAKARHHQAVLDRTCLRSQPEAWLTRLRRSCNYWGLVEREWKELPCWLLPAAVRDLSRIRDRPRLPELGNPEHVQSLLPEVKVA